jgi:hypothetical protein
MWTKLNEKTLVQGNFLLFFQEESQEWTVAKITQTGVKKQWIPEQSISESSLTDAMIWADTIFDKYGTMKYIRKANGSLRWVYNKANAAEQNRAL